MYGRRNGSRIRIVLSFHLRLEFATVHLPSTRTVPAWDTCKGFACAESRTKTTRSAQLSCSTKVPGFVRRPEPKLDRCRGGRDARVRTQRLRFQWMSMNNTRCDWLDRDVNGRHAKSLTDGKTHFRCTYGCHLFVVSLFANRKARPAHVRSRSVSSRKCNFNGTRVLRSTLATVPTRFACPK